MIKKNDTTPENVPTADVADGSKRLSLAVKRMKKLRMGVRAGPVTQTGVWTQRGGGR